LNLKAFSVSGDETKDERTGRPARSPSFGGGLIIQRNSPRKSTLGDALGSVRQLADVNGNIILVEKLPAVWRGDMQWVMLPSMKILIMQKTSKSKIALPVLYQRTNHIVLK